MIFPVIFDEKIKVIDDTIVLGIEPCRYSISSHGKIYDHKLNRYSPTFIHKQGYLQVSLRLIDKSFKLFLLHRLVALAFVDGDFSLIVNHKDGEKTNDNDWNLEWVTHSENNNHAFRYGLMPKGENSPNSIATENQIRLICKLLDMHKYSYSDIASMANVVTNDASSFISSIYKGVVWRDISKDYEFSKNNYATGRYRIYK